MIQCPICQIAHVHNTIFCRECGRYLLEDANVETIQVNEIGWMGNKTRYNGLASCLQANSTPRAIRLKISSRKREIEVPLNRTIHLGRVAPASNIFPEVDLSEDTRAKNISRRHARITKQAGAVVVEDLGSLNGTFVNGQRLSPYWPEVLSDGDTLQLGTLLIEVKFLKVADAI